MGLVIHPAKEIPLPEKRVKALEAYSASSLYGVHLERPPLIIQNIIPAGLSVLAGAPKRGKSWLALAMGIAVATGSDFLGMGTRKGDVLYMDLESRQYRVQDRLQQLMPGNFPERLWITHDAE
jgi:RecA-family ATPase